MTKIEMTKLIITKKTCSGFKSFIQNNKERFVKLNNNKYI